MVGKFHIQLFQKKRIKVTYMKASNSGLISGLGGTSSHVKCIPQLNPPRTMVDGVYTKEFGLIRSITGHATVFRLLWILNSSGSNQSLFTSQWLSRNTKTSPLAAFAPWSFPRMRPSLLLARRSLTLGLFSSTNDCIAFKSPRKEKKQIKVLQSKRNVLTIMFFLSFVWEMQTFDKNTDFFYKTKLTFTLKPYCIFLCWTISSTDQDFGKI